MLDYIWLFMIAGSFICSLISGRTEQLALAVSDGAGKAVRILIDMTGAVCLWSGLMKIADKCGISDFANRASSQFFRNMQCSQIIKNCCVI